MKTVQQELTEARSDGAAVVCVAPSLRLRSDLAQFALVNGLTNEHQALAVIAARYFRMVESERWAGWFTEEQA